MKWYWWTLIIAFLILGLCGSIPVSEASKPCLLGYHAVCPFSPISTAICLVAAAILFIIGRKRAKK